MSDLVGHLEDSFSRDMVHIVLYILSEMRLERQRRINITNTADDEIWNVGWITGSKFLSDGRLILSDTDDYKIKVFSRDFELEDTLSYRDGFVTLWAIGIINETTVVVTKPLHNQMEFVQYVPRLQRGRTVDLGMKCYGGDVLKDTIYLSCFDGRIRRYDRNGNFKRTMQMRRFQGPYWITANPVTEQLCVADWDARSVTCMTSDGDVTFTYTSASLSRPQAVLSDDRDNLIIADWDNMNIQVIKKSDRTEKYLLTKDEDGIWSPYSLAYRRSDKTLTVGQQWKKWFHIVKLTQIPWLT